MSQAELPSHREIEGGTLSEMDKSFRCPGLLLIASAIDWLLVALVFGVIASIQLVIPEFLSSSEWLTYGKVEAAFKTAFVYGWILNAAFALSLWIMARICHHRLPYTWMIFIAGIFWNIAVLIAVFGILAGDMTSISWMSMPSYASGLLLFAYTVMAAWGVAVFVTRKRFQTYVSQWYFLAALIVFPWVFSASHMMLFCLPANGVVQALLGAWFAQSFLGITLIAFGLGIAYYIIPKVLGKSIPFYYFANYGFWLLVFLSGLSGARYLIGSPVPIWNTTLSTAAAVLLIVPALIVAANLYGILYGSVSKSIASPSLRFIGFGVDLFIAFIVLGAVTSLRGVAEITRFTLVDEAYTFIGLAGFLSMVLFGGIYYMVPRILQREWPAICCIRLHWWLVATGVVTVFVSLLFGGWFQGLALNNPSLSSDASLSGTLIELLLWLRVFGMLSFGAGAFIFACNFYSNVSRGCCSASSCQGGTR